MCKKRYKNEQKELLHFCINDGLIEDELTAPTKEDELADLQRVLNSCDTIRKFEKRIQGDGWLTEKGKEFPAAIKKYFHQTVCNFYKNTNKLPSGFQDALREYITSTGSHITTLNYDDLLYDCFTDTAVFKNYHLRDGFFQKGFDFERAQKLYDKNRKEGWFLHLHGSPLFVNIGENLKKKKRSEFANIVGTESRHLVLTNVEFKQSTINGSEILSAYWKKLREIICDVEEIILFGYGGADTHLNDLIFRASRIHNVSIHVVEKCLGKSPQERLKYWQKALNFPVNETEYVEVQLMDDILEFKNWDKEVSIKPL